VPDPHEPRDHALARAALGRLGGAVLVVDAGLRIVWSSPEAATVLGEEPETGSSAVTVLCGDRLERPIAKALAEGRSVSGTLVRPRVGRPPQHLLVRASPVAVRKRAAGHVLVLEEVDPALEGDAPETLEGLSSRSPVMKQVFRIVRRAAAREVSVLVRGETGTGKELVGQAIHRLSPRARGPFLAVNCAALPASLLESTLFGHERGAFTGAVRAEPGLFRAADGGTLFLDEVAEMPLEVQAKLLRVLETHTVMPVGAQRTVPVDVRIVAATHRSLRAEVEAGRFREDLMYRLRVVPIRLPPLRARPGDVMLLATRMLDELNAAGGRAIASIGPEAQGVLERYPWPGNVRELRNALEHAYVVGDGPVLAPADLPDEIVHPDVGDEVISLPGVAAADDEMRRIRAALAQTGGHRGKAARLLGMSRVTLWRRLERGR
jgi:transcriptional regulator with PAS, ATPase and Fis domain